jgi:hypothetical protein
MTVDSDHYPIISLEDHINRTICVVVSSFNQRHGQQIITCIARETTTKHQMKHQQQKQGHSPVTLCRLWLPQCRKTIT